MARMKILVAPTSKIKKRPIIQGQQGFSIIEILMALSLLVVVFTLIPYTATETDRNRIESALQKINRSIRFSVNESILRNVIVRLRFDLETEPVEYSVEYGESATMTLPMAKDLSRLSVREREIEKEKLNRLDGFFTKVEEFQNSNEPLPDGIFINAFGTTYYPTLLYEGQVSIYMYPTGEKDNTIIILNSSTEIATLKIPAFEERTYTDFIVFNEFELDNFDSTLEQKSKELYTAWLKE